MYNPLLAVLLLLLHLQCIRGLNSATDVLQGRDRDVSEDDIPSDNNKKETTDHGLNV